MSYTTPPPPPDLRIGPVGPNDIKSFATIISQAFSSFPTEQRLGNTPDATGVQASAERHARAWREHQQDTRTNGSPAIQCIHRDPGTGEERTVACAEWFIHPDPVPRNDERGASYLISGLWLPSSSERAKLQATFKPALDIRAKWTSGRGFGLLMYMATSPSFRRRGAATLCVKWGIERCRELGIPAYLEASKEGAAVYEKLGFEVVEMVRMEMDGERFEFPAMVWWPPGTMEDGKVPLG